jgi:hypothetical protein
LVFLSSYTDGAAYTADEYTDMLTKNGFADIRITFQALNDGMVSVIAQKR